MRALGRRDTTGSRRRPAAVVAVLAVSVAGSGWWPPAAITAATAAPESVVVPAVSLPSDPPTDPPTESDGPAIAPLAEVLDQISSSALAAINDLPWRQVLTLARDDTSFVDADGRILVVDPPAESASGDDPVPSPPASPSATAATTTGRPSVASADDTFLLESKPGSKRVIYLDFDGAEVSGTAWNASTGIDPLIAEPFDLDGVPERFSDAELAWIRAVWAETAEDFAPFNVNVTTSDPGRDALVRSSTADDRFGSWALITSSGELQPDLCGACGGVAYVGVFDQVSSTGYNQPAWVFNQTDGGTISHEVGHNLGLSHDGAGGDSYSRGQGDVWGPLMGAPFSQPLTQWSRGEYAGADNTQDDYAVMADNGLVVRGDDHANTAVGATSFIEGVTGVISTPTDVDVFALAWPGGAITLSALPTAVRTNLDIRLEIRGAGGAVVASAAPVSSATSADWARGLSARISTTLAAGSYSIWVSGVGEGDPSTTGYTDYGSLGAYSISTSSPRVNVTRAGTGTGTVTGGLIDCGSTCSAAYASTSTVTLTARAAAGSVLSAWIGPCAEDGFETTCTVTTDTTRDVVAVFEPGRLVSLTVRGPMEWPVGMVDASNGSSCFATCSIVVPVESRLTLTANVMNRALTGWGGACSGRAITCSLIMSTNRAVTADFVTGVELSIEPSPSSEIRSGSMIESYYGSTCDSACTLMVPKNETVGLTAIERLNWLFDTWGGACSGPALTCSVVMSQDRLVTYRMVEGATVIVNFQRTDGGGGLVSSSPDGLSCRPGSCAGVFRPGRSVTLTAVPDGVSRFTGWSNMTGCGAAGSCTFTPQADVSLGAGFARRKVAVALDLVGRGSGEVRLDGVRCAADCSVSVGVGRPVDLIATPADGSLFVGWTGVACGTTPTCSVTPDAPVTVTARFARVQHSLTVRVAGSGTVRSTPTGIACADRCSTDVDSGSTVSLRAKPAPGHRFVRWRPMLSPDCARTTTCSLVVRSDMRIRAVFRPVG